MKKILLTLFLLLLFIFNTDAQEIKKDKLLHFYAGAFLSGASSLVYINSTYKPTLKGKIFISFGSALAVGLAKEIYDINRTGFSVADLGATVLGAVPITFVFTLDNLKKKKRKL
jgi:hypothetical protein